MAKDWNLEIQKQQQKLEKLKRKAREEEEKQYRKIGQLYVKVQKYLDSSLDFETLITQLTEEFDELNSKGNEKIKLSLEGEEAQALVD